MNDEKRVEELAVYLRKLTDEQKLWLIDLMRDCLSGNADALQTALREQERKNA